MSFSTALSLSGPLRHPRQMLAEQEYGGHASIHDEQMAEDLGFSGAPIEGPTHFSQFVPLLERIWGAAWHESGCISAHYQNMCIEGDAVRAFVEIPPDGSTRTRAWAEKADGTAVLEASASIDGDDQPTLLDERMAKLRPSDRFVILENLEMGMAGPAGETVRMDFDQHMGLLYPFTLRQKLDKITEKSDHYAPEATTPWGGPIIPLEMISVLCEYTSHQARFPVKGPAVGLFADQEIRVMGGPLMVGEDYALSREVVAMSQSRRTESYWVRTTLSDLDSGVTRAEMLLNHATLKDSYARYPQG